MSEGGGIHGPFPENKRGDVVDGSGLSPQPTVRSKEERRGTNQGGGGSSDETNRERWNPRGRSRQNKGDVRRIRIPSPQRTTRKKPSSMRGDRGMHSRFSFLPKARSLSSIAEDLLRRGRLSHPPPRTGGCAVVKTSQRSWDEDTNHETTNPTTSMDERRGDVPSEGRTMPRRGRDAIGHEEEGEEGPSIRAFVLACGRVQAWCRRNDTPSHERTEANVDEEGRTRRRRLLFRAKTRRRAWHPHATRSRSCERIVPTARQTHLRRRCFEPRTQKSHTTCVASRLHTRRSRPSNLAHPFDTSRRSVATPRGSTVAVSCVATVHARTCTCHGASAASSWLYVGRKDATILRRHAKQERRSKRKCTCARYRRRINHETKDACDGTAKHTRVDVVLRRGARQRDVRTSSRMQPSNRWCHRSATSASGVDTSTSHRYKPNA